MITNLSPRCATCSGNAAAGYTVRDELKTIIRSHWDVSSAALHGLFGHGLAEGNRRCLIRPPQEGMGLCVGFADIEIQLR